MAVLSHAELASLWIASGGFPGTADVAASIAQAESGGDTTKINNTAYPSRPGYRKPGPGALPEYSVGLWQVNELAHPSYTTAELLSAQGNAHAAVAISNDGASFSAWSTYVSGAYKAFLQSAGVPTSQPGLTPGLSAVAATASGHRGFADLRNSLARHLPTQLVHSRRAGLTTLHVLAARHRVGR